MTATTDMVYNAAGAMSMRRVLSGTICTLIKMHRVERGVIPRYDVQHEGSRDSGKCRLCLVTSNAVCQLDKGLNKKYIHLSAHYGYL